MKKYFTFLIFGLILFSSCKKKSFEKNCKLNSVSVSALIYDEYQFCPQFDPNAPKKVEFEYDNNNKISKVSGGLTLVACGSTFGMWILWDSAYQLVTYNGSTIIAQHFTYPGSQQAYEVREFVIKNDIVESVRITKPSAPNSTPIENTYQLNGNLIEEKRNGNLFRTFTIENNNLVKAERIFKNQFTGEIGGKTEILFQNYDNKVNYLRGKYFIVGAFYKAFSKNNYTKITTRNFSYENNTYKLVQETSVDFPLKYNGDDVAEIFEVQCND